VIIVDAYRSVVFHIFDATWPAYSLTHFTLFIFAGIGSLFLELHNVIKLGYYNLRGKVSDLTEFGLNPSEITEEQAKLNPVILIHGIRHGHGVWIEFAKSLQKNEIQNPVFTVNLGDERSKSLSETIAKIEKVYQKAGCDKFKVDLVGYSAGGIAALHYYTFGKNEGWEHTEKVRRIITLGTPNREIYKTSINVYDIRGRYDFICPTGLITCNVDTGHFGLPFSEETHHAIFALIGQQALPQS